VVREEGEVVEVESGDLDMGLEAGLVMVQDMDLLMVSEVEAQEMEVGLVMARDMGVDLAMGVVGVEVVKEVVVVVVEAVEVVVVAVLAMGQAWAMVQAMALVGVTVISHKHKLFSLRSI
jgi:hypothetical protein